MSCAASRASSGCCREWVSPNRCRSLRLLRRATQIGIDPTIWPMLSARLDEYLDRSGCIAAEEAALTALQCSASRDPASMGGEGRDDACRVKPWLKSPARWKPAQSPDESRVVQSLRDGLAAGPEILP